MGYPLGGSFKVQGDIKGDALIVAPFWGTEVGGGQNNLIYWHITGGVVGEPTIRPVTGFVGINWMPTYWNTVDNSPLAFTPLGTRIEDGLLLSVYDENALYYVDGTTFACSKLLDPYNADNFPNAPINRSISAKHFNNARYVALFATGAWPAWAVNTYIYLYDMTSLAGMSGTIEATTALMFNLQPETFYEQGGGTGGGVAPVGDIILVPSSDGYYMSLYCIDNNNRLLVGYQVDCIDRDATEEEGE
jgi:hypothetical protein